MNVAAAQKLPIAPARRAAIFGALWKAAAVDAHLRRITDAFGATRIDDLCGLAVLADRAGISDIALALAAAEDTAAVSIVARILYTARLQLRSAGFDQTLQQQALQQQTLQQQTLQQRTFRSVSYPDLTAAFEALREAGATQVCVPRVLLDAMRGTERQSQGRAPLAAAVSAMLMAGYSQDESQLVAALCGPPYLIDSAQLRFALAAATAASAPMSVRDTLAAAIATLPGASAKEALLGALAAVDAALAQTEEILPSLAAAAAGVHAAVQSFAMTIGIQTGDPDFDELELAAMSADRVWACTPDPPSMAARVANLLEAIARIRVDATLELVADADPVGSVRASIEFADSCDMPVRWDTFAAALDVRGDARAKLADTDQLRARVAAPLEDAVSEYFLARTQAGGNRTWPLAETAAVIKAPRMTFSASRLNAYVKCPRRWFYEYLCEALEDPGSVHAAYGRVVHDALEALHRQIRVPSRHESGIILERLLHELDAAFGRAREHFSSQLEYEVSRMRARRMAEQYVRWLVLESSRAPMEIVHVELLQRLRLQEHDFVGYIDRIDRPLAGGPVTIYDYKTGRIGDDAAQYLESVRRGDEAQLALYYAMRRAGGDEIARIALVSIRDPRDNAWILALDIVDDDGKLIIEREPHDGVLRASCSRADLETSLAALVARCDLLTQQGLEHFPAGEDPPCNFCAYAISCRERPADEERIFAR